MTARYKPPYKLVYLNAEDYEVYGARPCQFCCFGGRQLDCRSLCRALGQRALFILNDSNHITQHRVHLQRLRQRIDAEIREARQEHNNLPPQPPTLNIITNYEDI